MPAAELSPTSLLLWMTAGTAPNALLTQPHVTSRPYAVAARIPSAYGRWMATAPAWRVRVSPCAQVRFVDTQLFYQLSKTEISVRYWNHNFPHESFPWFKKYGFTTGKTKKTCLSKVRSPPTGLAYTIQSFSHF